MNTPRGMATAIVLAMMALVVSTACGAGAPPPAPTTVTVTRSTAARIEPSVTSSSSIPAPGTTVLANRYASLAKGLPGKVGVAIAAVGAGGEPVVLGDLTTGVAWSTIKVPLAIAASRRAGTRVASAVRRAIVESDNDAAYQLWNSLGASTAAAQATQAVLREAGDTVTVVQSQQVRGPDFTPFGQTQWSLVQQARFAAGLPCIPDSGIVVGLMGRVAGNQQWGVETASSPALVATAVKGGWGPGPDGGYLVRQLGLVTTSRGLTAVALATLPDAGSFEAGTAVLDTVGGWLAKNVDALPAGRC
ncbi:serine hydrolase [Williamsia sterculiae]|uniref:Beta-lactamase enzyme family protein n=1 Tax=Williamsia sterculiae TaxID=1344003 RepID=A0A1N7DR10_9NOCA|nr:hypothetical protein [Williamsia sterculiae]SIR78191.1 hypothetical protein SAMN05445060_0829 [Williamsia sterculiae]